MARIKDLAELSGQAIRLDDDFVVSHETDGQEMKFKLSSLIARLFGGRVVGGGGGGDITVNDATQDMSNKTLIEPKINSSVRTAVTSEDLNKLHQVSASAAQINSLVGVHSNIQQQLNGKMDAKAYVNATANPYAAVSVILDVADFGVKSKCSENDLKAELGLGPDVGIKHAVVTSVVSFGHPERGVNVNLENMIETHVDDDGRFLQLNFAGFNHGERHLIVVSCTLEKK